MDYNTIRIIMTGVIIVWIIVAFVWIVVTFVGTSRLWGYFNDEQG